MSNLSKRLMNSGMYLRVILSFFDSDLRMDVIRSGEWMCMKVHFFVIWMGPSLSVVKSIIAGLI